MREESFWAGVFRCSSLLTFLPCPPLDLLLAARQGGCCAIRWSGRVCICVRKRGRKEQQQPSLLPVSVWVCGWVSVCFSLRQSLVRAASQGMWGGERERERGWGRVKSSSAALPAMISFHTPARSRHIPPSLPSTALLFTFPSLPWKPGGPMLSRFHSGFLISLPTTPQFSPPFKLSSLWSLCHASADHISIPNGRQ